MLKCKNIKTILFVPNDFWKEEILGRESECSSYPPTAIFSGETSLWIDLCRILKLDDHLSGNDVVALILYHDGEFVHEGVDRLARCLARKEDVTKFGNRFSCEVSQDWLPDRTWMLDYIKNCFVQNITYIDSPPKKFGRLGSGWPWDGWCVVPTIADLPEHDYWSEKDEMCLNAWTLATICEFKEMGHVIIEQDVE